MMLPRTASGVPMAVRDQDDEPPGKESAQTSPRGLLRPETTLRQGVKWADTKNLAQDDTGVEAASPEQVLLIEKQ